jgi:hypothetical protein
MNKATPNTSSLKKLVKGIPFLAPTARALVNLPPFVRARQLAFPGSASFWETRYRNGGTSGSGSYGRLAEFKAEILNEFVRTNGIRTTIEFGCGDGSQLELAEYPQYVGIDVATLPVERCRARFAHDATKKFYPAESLPEDLGMFDLALSLDVIYHLVEDSVFDSYMRSLFTRSQRYVVIYASNYDAPTKSPHVRHRRFTAWIAQNLLDWHPAGFVPNRFPFDPHQPDETSFADFHFFGRQGS